MARWLSICSNSCGAAFVAQRTDAFLQQLVGDQRFFGLPCIALRCERAMAPPPDVCGERPAPSDDVPARHTAPPRVAKPRAPRPARQPADERCKDRSERESGSLFPASAEPGAMRSRGTAPLRRRRVPGSRSCRRTSPYRAPRSRHLSRLVKTRWTRFPRGACAPLRRYR